MRDAVCGALVGLHRDKEFVFFTGDLGFMALEPLKEVMGALFINAGVAEQNMVSVAAGVASEGMQVWAYSIAPFVYARPLEQIRNDVCFHGFDVKLVGNGGGYAYGSMGATHHALEDYGIMLALQGMRVFVPVFTEDLVAVVRRMSATRGPAYLRLGRGEKPAGFPVPAYAPWRKIVAGGGPVLLAVGPLCGGYIEPLLKLEEKARPQLWALGELPIETYPPPAEFIAEVKDRGALFVAEEHVLQGSVGQSLAHYLAVGGVRYRTFAHFHAAGYPSGLYGSQAFHRKESGIDAQSVIQRIDETMRTNE